MKHKIFLERITLFLMITLVVISGLWFMVFAIKESLQYSLFSNISNDFFMMSIFGIICSLVGIAVVNISLNLGIISNHFVKTDGIESEKPIIKPLLISVGAIFGCFIVVFLSLHTLNKVNTNNKINEIKTEMKQVVEAYPSVLDTIAIDIKNDDNANRIKSNLKIISSNAPYFRDLDVVFWRAKDGKRAFLFLTNWSNNTIDYTLSSLSGTMLMPNKFELNYLNNAIDKNLEEPGVFVQRPNYKIFQPIKSNGKVECFLLSDYHRVDRNSYK